MFLVTTEWALNWWTNVRGAGADYKQISGCSTSGASTTITGSNFAAYGITVGLGVYGAAITTPVTVTAVTTSSITVSAAVTLTSATLMFSSGTVFLWGGSSGGTVMGTTALASVANVNVVHHSARLQDFYIRYPYASLASGSTGIYLSLPSGHVEDVIVGTDKQADYTVASCTASGTSITNSGSVNFVTAGVQVGMVISGGAAGVPAGTTVTAVTSSTVTASASCTTSNAALMFSYAPVAGTAGIDLDGCQNPGMVNVDHVHVNGQFDDSFRIRTDLAILTGCQAAYGNNGLRINQDSTNSVSGPPYNVTATGFHSYHSLQAASRISRATGLVKILNLFDEDPMDVAWALTCDGTAQDTAGVGFTGFAQADISSLSGKLLQMWNTTARVLMTQPTQAAAGVPVLYTGNASTGTPTPPYQISTQRSFVELAGSSTASTTAVAAGFSGAQKAGQSGAFIARLSGFGTNTVANDGFEITFWYMAATPPANGTAPGTGTQMRAPVVVTVPVASGNVPFCVEANLTGQLNNVYYIGVLLNAVTGGTATLSGLSLTVDSY
jgi:hypothetical protein